MCVVEVSKRRSAGSSSNLILWCGLASIVEEPTIEYAGIIAARLSR
jgi:hypothetical protein